MTFCFLRSFNREFPLYFSNKVLSHRFYSVFLPVHCKLEKYNDMKEYKHKKILQINKENCRHFSLPSYYSKFFDFVTSSEPSIFLRNVLIDLHDITNLPWWYTIVGAALVSRLTVSLPFGVYQHVILAKIKLTDEELKCKLPELKEEVFLRSRRGNWNDRKTNFTYAFEINKLRKQLQIKNNCHPFKCVILALTPIPLWVLMTFTLRKMALDVCSPGADSLKTLKELFSEGLFWSHDLTVPDTTLTLPLVIFFSFLTIIEINLLSARSTLGLLPKIMTNVSRILAVMFLLVSTQTPLCVSLFWAASILSGVFQTLLLLSPRVRRFCRIPKTSAESDKPYSQIFIKFKEKYLGFITTQNKSTRSN